MALELRLIFAAALFSASPLHASLAQDAISLPTAPVLTAKAAQAIMAAAQTEAAKNAPSSIVIVDVSGAPLLMVRMDGAVPASAKVAAGKAETAAAFRVSTKGLEDGVNGPRPALISSNYLTMQGGIPLLSGGHLVGAIGVSGGTKEQDELAATAGAAVLGK